MKAQEQQDFLDKFYKNVKASIRENKLYVNPNAFGPTKKIVLEISLEAVRDDLDIPKEKLYEVIGRAICEAEQTVSKVNKKSVKAVVEFIEEEIQRLYGLYTESADKTAGEYEELAYQIKERFGINE